MVGPAPVRVAPGPVTREVVAGEGEVRLLEALVVAPGAAGVGRSGEIKHRGKNYCYAITNAGKMKEEGKSAGEVRKRKKKRGESTTAKHRPKGAPQAREGRGREGTEKERGGTRYYW